MREEEWGWEVGWDKADRGKAHIDFVQTSSFWRNSTKPVRSTHFDALSKATPRHVKPCVVWIRAPHSSCPKLLQGRKKRIEFILYYYSIKFRQLMQGVPYRPPRKSIHQKLVLSGLRCAITLLSITVATL